ncbi:hypothetical protein [Variovorax sp. dw_954]|uniref:GH39 family glycosyl hydrolase n=1 Tax=Variovorax sp. dw_954 TaxID=2720078 RepID=UPI001BD5D820|nr:hypothetical protein [Variovorax sp. dw_954]
MGHPAYPLTRRAWLAGSTLAVGAGGMLLQSSCRARPGPAGPDDATFAPSNESHAFDVTIDARAAGTPVNRRVLGSNVGWVYGGDNMVKQDGGFAPAMLAMARRLGPTVLRFPGGTFSDVFHWEAPVNEHVFSRERQRTLMDTRRFLELCEAVDAQPLITVNIVTGTAEEAARWVAATNVGRMTSRITGRKLPRVAYWEMGNEPYLKEESRADVNLPPQEFARRVNAFIRAMRAVDPDIVIGLPLTTDQRAGLPVTPYPGFTRKVLGTVTERFDYACLHNAYMPFGYKHGMSPAELYWGAAAGALTVKRDFGVMRQLLADVRPGQKLPLAVTEYSALFSLGRGPSDKWTSAPAGAIFLADVLRVFAETPDVLLANYWSLSANGLFGAIHAGAFPRPAFQVLQLMGEALQGQRIQAAVQSETVRVASIGQVEAVDAMPLVEILATRADASGGRAALRMIVINKDPRRAALGQFGFGAVRAAQARMSLLSSDDVFDAGDKPDMLARSESPLEVRANQKLSARLPPHSVALITVDIPSS